MINHYKYILLFLSFAFIVKFCTSSFFPVVFVVDDDGREKWILSKGVFSLSGKKNNNNKIIINELCYF